MNKTAIVIFSDPNSGSDEANGRLLNALVAARDLDQAGNEVTILFQGAGTRWAALLSKPDHPFHTFFEPVQGKVSGVSCACADVFGAAEGATASGLPVVPTSLAGLSSAGYNILSF